MDNARNKIYVSENDIILSSDTYYLTLFTGREVQQLLGHDMEVSCLALSQSGTILASGSHDKTAILWNTDSYEQLFMLQVDDPVDALAFSVDNQHLFTGSYTGKYFNFQSNEATTDLISCTTDYN